MKNLLRLAVCGLLLVSCQKEFSLQNTVNPPGPTPGSTDCFTCDYFPLCDSSRFEYIDTLGGNVSNSTTLVNLLGDSSINGASWKKIKDVNTGQRFYTNCANGAVQLFFASGTSAGGSTVSNIYQTPIKANAAIGETWMDVILNPLGQRVEYRYTMIAKNLTRQVYDSTYTNVIYVRDTSWLMASGLPPMASAVRHIYFARGVGQVEVRTEDVNSGLTIMTRKLKSYRL